jgi:hypothetical protein
MSDKYFIQTVLEDLQHLGRAWNDSVDDSVLRRDSTILRRLLIDGDLNEAWKMLGFKQKIFVFAPRAEYFLETKESHKINFILSGGGLYQGIFAALAIHNKGKEAVTLPSHINPIEHKFTLSEFLDSVSIFVENTKISRRELIQYVANKLGGVHIDFSRKGRLAQKFETLDRNIDRFKFEGKLALRGKNTVYFELLSIGQLLSNSKDIKQFSLKAEEFVLS